MGILEFWKNLLTNNVAGFYSTPVKHQTYLLDDDSAVIAAKNVDWYSMMYGQAIIARYQNIGPDQFHGFPTAFPDPGRVPEWWDTL